MRTTTDNASLSWYSWFYGYTGACGLEGEV